MFLLASPSANMPSTSISRRVSGCVDPERSRVATDVRVPDASSIASSAGIVASPTAAASSDATISSADASRGSTPRAPARTASAVQAIVGLGAMSTTAGERDAASGDSVTSEATAGGVRSLLSTASSTTCGSCASMSSASDSPDDAPTTVTEALRVRSASSPALTTGDAAATSVRITPRDFLCPRVLRRSPRGTA